MSDLRFSVDELFSDDPELLTFVKTVTQPRARIYERQPNAPPEEKSERTDINVSVSEKHEPDRTDSYNREQAKQAAKKPGMRILSNILFYGALLGIFLAVFKFSTNDDPKKSIMGYRYYEILTGSMRSVYPQGSVVIVKLMDPGEIVVGDDITYYREDGISTITHRVIEVVEDIDGEGTRGFRTQGVDNPTPDVGIIDGRSVVGTVKMYIPYVGAVISYLSERIYLAILLFVLLALLFSLLVALLKKEPGKRQPKREEQFGT